MPPKHKPWWKVDADADESDKLAKLPSDQARWAWFRMLCRAKTQRQMGVFAGRSHLKTLLGLHGRFVPDLVRVGVAHDWPTDCQKCSTDYAGVAVAGDLVVHDYRREQRDPTNAERQSAYRDRNGVGNAPSNDVSNGLSRVLSPSLSSSPSSSTGEDDGYQVATPPEANDLRLLAEQLTGQPNALSNVWSGLGEKAVRLARKHGLPAVEREWRRIAAEEGGMPELRQLVFGADEALNRIRRTPTTTETAEEREQRELAELKAAAARNMPAAQGATR
jgi:hypothetical protein